MKKVISIFIILLLLQQTGFTQKTGQKIIDSLQHTLTATTNENAKIEILFNLIQASHGYNPQQAAAYQNQVMEIARKTGSKETLALVYGQIGRIKWRAGNFKEALENHFEALNIYTETKHTVYINEMLSWIAQDYLDDGKYEEAKTYLLKSLKGSEEAGDKEKVSSAYDILIYLYSMQGNVAEATKTMYLFLKLNEELGDKAGITHGASMLAANFQTLGNYTEALKYFKQALKAAKEGNDKWQEAHLNGDIANLYITTGNLEEATTYYTAALELANEVMQADLLADIYYGVGDLHQAKKNYTEALAYYLLAATEYHKIVNKQSLARLYSTIAVVYTRLNNHQQAKKYLNNAWLLSNEMKSSASLGDYYNGAQLLDSATGNWKNAYTHYKEYIATRDSNFNKETLKKLVAAQIQYEAEKKEAIEKAEREKKDVKTQEEVKRQRNLRNYAFAVVAVTILFSIVVYRQRNKTVREKKRSDALLRDKELLLREIHHRVKNNLEVVSSLLALQSAQIDDPNTKEAMLAGQNRVHSIGIVHQKLYQGENLGTIEMKDYFLNLSESILDSFDAAARVNVVLDMESLDVDIDTAVPLGLIVNELFTNALKYAFPGMKKGTIHIKLDKEKQGFLQLHFSDDGVGKSGTTQGTGFGGQLVSLLTKQLNGSMKEEINNGTHIYFAFKLKGQVPA